MPRFFFRFSLFIMLLGLHAPFAQAAPKEATVTLAGGCFWGIEAVYEHTKGVTNAVSGYAGGSAATANYAQVSTGTSGHAEAVQVTYDPAQVTLAELLRVYFGVAHNPTQLNYQGPDHGTQYRSTLFYADAAQKTEMENAIASLGSEKRYDAPVVTTLEPLKAFYPAEKEHQDFAAAHPAHPYIVQHDAPKVAALKKEFPALYRDTTVTP